MRICLCSDIDITPFLSLWGNRKSEQFSNPTWVANLIVGLRQFPDVELHVLTLSPYVLSDKDAVVEGVRYHFLRAFRRAKLRLGTFYYFDVRKLLRRLRSIKPDLVHAHFNGEYHLAAMRSGYPFIATVHALMWRQIEYQGFSVTLKVLEMIQKYALRRSPSAICVSRYVEQELKEQLRFSGDTYILPNAIDPDYFHLAVDGTGVPKKPRILYVGDISPRKNALVLFEALALVGKRYPDCQVRLAGPISKKLGQTYRRTLEDRACALGVQNNVHFLGYCGKERLVAELKDADLLVHPAREETFCMTVAEAMAAGKPVIATPVGAIPDFIEDGKCGFLIGPDDAPLLAARILTLLGDVQLRERFGKLGREVILRKLHPRLVAENHAEVYREVVRGWKA